MKKSSRTKAILAMMLFLSSGVAMANNTALTSGNWETGSNWSTGVAPTATDNVVIPGGIQMTIGVTGDVCATLNIASSGWAYINASGSLAIGGSLTNAGTFTSIAGSTVTFNGSANSIVSGGGSYSIAGTIVLDLGAAATYLDVQDAGFISGINSGGKYYFTFTRGTFKMDNTGTLNDCYNSGSTNALTIPYGVVIESDNGTMNLAKNGTMATIGNGISSYGQSNIILSGKLFINGGTVDVAMGQPASSNSGQTPAMGVDLQYYAAGGTPQLYMTSGNLNLGSGFNYYRTSDYVDFNMSGGTIIAALSGSSYMGTFQLNDAGAGKTVMTGGMIELTDASWGNYPDVDLGGTNVAGNLYSVTGGTIQFGSPATANAGTYFAFEAWSTTNYPNFDFESGMAKVAQPLNNSDFRVYSLTANANMTFNVADYLTGNSTKNMYIDGNNGTWAFDDEGGFIEGTSTVNFIGAVPQKINSSALGTENFYNLVIATLAGATTSVSGSVTTVNVAGNLAVNSGAFSAGTMTTLDISGNTTLNAGTFNAPTTINASGNWTNNGGSFVPSTGTVNFKGSGGQAINGTAGTQTFNNVTALLTAGQTLSTGGSTTALIMNNLTETTGNISGPASLNISGNLLLSSGTFTAGASTKVGGNFTNNSGGFTAGSNTVTFNGSTAQTIGGTAGTTFNNMTISNSGGHVNLGIATTAAGQLAFALGMLDASNYPLTITSGTAITGTSANSYIITGNGVSTTGKLNINNLPVNTSTLFPVGTAAYYFPATLNPGSTAGNGYSAYVFNPATLNAVSNGPLFGSAMLAGILNVVWNINQSAGSGSATLGLNWASSGTSLDGSSFVGAGTNIGISQYTGGWQEAIGSGNVATTSATASFGTFTQFMVDEQNFTLPVVISPFNAFLNDNRTVGLTWTVSDGQTIADFEVQRSDDATNWSTIGTVAAIGTEAGTNYSFTDANPGSGMNYYRLLVQNMDGTYSYTAIRSVSLSSMAAIGIYPNPTSDRINISLNDGSPDLSIRLISLSGQVLQSVAPGTAGASVTTMSVRQYAAGIYLVQIVGGGKVLQVSSVVVTH